MNIIGLIPARGGSKKIPQKNIKLLCGKPLIAYTIESAIKSNSLSRVIVSTDNEKIAATAKKYGAEVPFLRPPALAQDDTPDRPVILHLIDWLYNNENNSCDLIVILRPTTPFKTSNLIDNCVEKLVTSPQFSSLRTVTCVKGAFHPYWMFRVENDVLMPIIDGITIEKFYQRQLLPLCYRLNGVIDVVRKEVVSESNNIYGHNIGYVEIPETMSVDIDTDFDFKFCEFLMRKQS